MDLLWSVASSEISTLILNERLIMKVYCTSKNTVPNWTGSDPIYLKYLGTSLEDAVAAVGDFVKYEKEKDQFPTEFKHIYSVLDKVVEYYMADGWWYSVVVFNLEPLSGNGLPQQRSEECSNVREYLKFVD